MTREEQDWMAYIDREVRATCDAKGWRSQIRRKEWIRDKPEAQSPIDDYEWKLVPPVETPPLRPLFESEGIYYILSFQLSDMSFLFQHDTHHGGILSPYWELTTYTRITWTGQLFPCGEDPWAARNREIPPCGWLRNHLERLVARFAPNSFSAT